MWQVQVVILEDPDGHEICFVGKFTVPPTSVADQDPTRQWPGLINTVLKNMKKKHSKSSGFFNYELAKVYRYFLAK